MAPLTIVLFGATGDLARHKLFPALAVLEQSGALPDEIRILGIGRRPYDSATFRQFLAETLPERQRSVLKWVEYVPMDFLQPEGYGALARRCLSRDGEDSIMCYLAVDPAAVATVAQHVADSGLSRTKNGGWFRLVLEKPFGHDLSSAKRLDALLGRLFTEEQLYRIDHYLAKETVQNLLAFRFANGIFEPIWNADSIDHVQITVAEQGGIGSRGAFYDQTGATRDFLQNHILQLLALVTMETPQDTGFGALASAASRAVALTRLDPAKTVFGQYEGYRQEDRVRPDSVTETFVATVAEVASPRWQGVPFYLRTGKKLAERLSEVSIQFKVPQQRLFGFALPDHRSNLLTFRLQPDEGMALELGVKVPGSNMELRPVAMEFCYASGFGASLPDAYERLLLDVLQGDRSLALASRSIEAGWAAVDQLLAAKKDLHTYAPGGWGPQEADDLIARSGRRWYAHESAVCNGVRLPAT